jgi:type I restriction enzyme S subunit
MIMCGNSNLRLDNQKTAKDDGMYLWSICEAIVDCEHKTAPVQPEGIPLIRTANIKNGRIDIDRAARISEKTWLEWSMRIEPKPWDIIMSREAPVGEIGLVPPNERVCLGQRTVLIRPNQQIANPRYLLYLLLTKPMQNQMKSLAEGSTVPHLNMSAIRMLKLPELPSLKCQLSIANILGTLDDKIALNSKINKTIESIAKAVFKHWFIDFEFPYETGKPYKSSGGKIKRSGSRGAPANWTVGKINDICSISKQTINPNAFPNKEFSHYSIPSFDNNENPELTSGASILSSKFVIPNNAVLLSKLNPRIARVWLPQVEATRYAVCSTEFIVLKPREGYTREFLYLLFTSSPFRQQFESLVTGTSGSHQRVRPSELLDIEAILPDQSIVQTFSKLIAPIFSLIASNSKESICLALIRNALLPKLMSGAIEASSTQIKHSEAAPAPQASTLEQKTLPIWYDLSDLDGG